MGKKQQKFEAKMKNLYEPQPKMAKPKREQRGGCGNPDCSICYNQDGSLRDEGGRIQTAGDSAMVTPSQRELLERYQSMRMGIGTTYAWDTSASVPQEPETKRTLDAARKGVEDYIVNTSHAVEWDDVVGNDRARTELQEALEASTSDAELYTFYEMVPPKGVLLWGPPGCGKTMFGKAATTSISRLLGKDSELLLLNGAEIESPFVSVAGSRIKKVFEYARAFKAHHGVPAVIFIDEADALLQQRDKHPVATEVVSAFLSEMDGLKENGAFIILATNRPDKIDEAVLRDGRVDRKIKIDRPTYDAAKAIVQAQLDKAGGWAEGLSTEVLDDIYSAEFLIRELRNPQTGVKHHFLLQHVVNGAMLVGLIARAKTLAFRRDKSEGTQYGAVPDDLRQAIRDVYEENKGLTHEAAMEEFVEEVALPIEALREQQKG